MRRFIGLAIFLALLVGITTVSGQQAEPPKVPSKEPTKFEYPKLIGGKNLDMWVREMRENLDPSMRELALRTLPMFGPDVRKAASANFLHALTKDSDYAVRMSALSLVPLIGFEEKEAKAGIKAMIEYTKSPQVQCRYDAIAALGDCGGIAREAIPVIVDFGLLDTNSWQIRRISAQTLGKLAYDPDNGPETKAMSGLIRTLLTEKAIQVRREVVQAVLLLGIPQEKQTWVDLRRALEGVKRDPDKSLGIWARVCLMRLEDKKVTQKDPNMRDLLNYLTHTDPAVRVEAIQGMGAMAGEVTYTLPDLQKVIDKDEDINAAGAAIWVLTAMTSEAQTVVPYLEGVKKSHRTEAIRRTAEEALKAMIEIKKMETKDPKKEAVPKKEILPKKDPAKK